jgi:dipeptidase E
MRLLLISSSLVHGHGYLDHAENALRDILRERHSVSFVPFAGYDHESYTNTVRERLKVMGYEVHQVRSSDDIEKAEAVFIGGGNSFRLIKALYDRGLIDVIRRRVRGGMPYIGSSAGTNVSTPSIRTTNDMPIVQPPSFEALGLVPFQINPHYLDPDPASTHKGETREQRILEFHQENATPVAGLREASMLSRDGEQLTLLGPLTMRVFRRGMEPAELSPGDVSELLKAGE